MEEYHAQCDGQNKVILLDLLNNATAEDVKTIIQHFDVDKNSDDIYKLMNASLKPPLVETAEYLKINSTQLKDQLIRSIICKINSLLLEKCLKCSQYYAAKLQDDPIAVCECGQPCHEPCYSELKEVLNGSFPGVVFQCSRCFKKPAQFITTKAAPETATENPQIQQSESVEIEKEPIKTFTLKVINAFNLDLLQSLYPKSSPYPICEGYKRFNCPHGKDGKTEIQGEPCKHLHPKKCFAWCKAGSDRRYGCTKDKDCPYFHPVICRNSIRYKRCLNPDCTYAHLKFTKRYREKTSERPIQWFDQETISRPSYNSDHRNPHTENNHPNSDHRNSRENVMNRPPNNQQPPWKSKPTAETDKDNMRSFLEDLVQSLRKDMQTNQTEMREFKHNVTKQMSQIHQSLPQYQNQFHHQVHIDPNAVHNQVYQNQPQHHHQVHMDPSVAHHQIQHMQQIQVNQTEGATFHQVPQHHMMMKPLGRT